MIRIFVNGKELKIILRLRRMSQKDLASKTGLTPVYISRIINQQSPVGLGAQKKIQSVIRFIPFERMFTTVDK